MNFLYKIWTFSSNFVNIWTFSSGNTAAHSVVRIMYACVQKLMGNSSKTIN